MISRQESWMRSRRCERTEIAGGEVILRQAFLKELRVQQYAG